MDISDLESLYSLEDEITDKTLCSIAYSDYSDDESIPEHPDIEVFMIKPLEVLLVDQPHSSLSHHTRTLPLEKAKPEKLLTSTTATGKVADVMSPTVTNFLTKPRHCKSSKPNTQQHMINPLVFTIDKATPSPSTPQIDTQHFPEEITEIIADLTLSKRSVLNWKTFYSILLAKHGPFQKNPMVHPDYPFLTIFHIHELFELPKEALCFFWYLFETHTVAITFNAYKLFTYLFQCQFEHIPKECKHLFTLFQWFLPAHQWVQKLNISHKTYVVIFFKRPCCFLPATAVGGNTSLVYHSPTASIHTWHDIDPSNCHFELRHVQQLLELRHDLIWANHVLFTSIPVAVIEGRETVPERHPDIVLWKETLRQWFLVNPTKNIDSVNDGIDRDNYYYLDEDVDHDPYEDDPDSQWK